MSTHKNAYKFICGKKMQYKDLKKDTAYKVVGGINDNLIPGDVFWIDSACGSLILAGPYGGWIEKEDVDDSFFAGLNIKPAKGYSVTTKPNGNTRLEVITE